MLVLKGIFGGSPKITLQNGNNPKRLKITRKIFPDLMGTHIRAFLNLWFAKPMVCLRVVSHENDGNYENDENDEDNSDSYMGGQKCHKSK